MEQAGELRYAGAAPRAIAVVVDVVVVGIPLALLMGAGYHHEGTAGINLTGWDTLVWALLMLVYYVIAELLVGTTIGKRVVSLRVTDETGGPLRPGPAIVRNLARFLDGFPYVLPYLVGVLVMSGDAKNRRLGDRFAHTVVVYRS